MTATMTTRHFSPSRQSTKLSTGRTRTGAKKAANTSVISLTCRLPGRCDEAEHGLTRDAFLYASHGQTDLAFVIDWISRNAQNATEAEKWRRNIKDMTRDDLRELANDLRRQESGHVEIETIDQPIDVPIEVETAEAIGAADELVFDAEELAELRRRVAVEARAEEVAEAAELKQRQELDRHLNNDEGSSGYQRLMYKAWGIRKLKAGPKLTLFAILRYCWSDDHCTVSEEFLAADTGAGVRSIQRYVNELEKKRYIGVYRRSNGRNTYTVRDRELIPRRVNKKKQHA